MNYSEKLKDPRWQKKRLKILERDDWTCQSCGNNNLTLNVHHLKYSGEPWEIEDEYLITVCENCHKKKYLKQSIDDLISVIIKNKGDCPLFGIIEDLTEQLSEMVIKTILEISRYGVDLEYSLKPEYENIIKLKKENGITAD